MTEVTDSTRRRGGRGDARRTGCAARSAGGIGRGAHAQSTSQFRWCFERAPLVRCHSPAVRPATQPVCWSTRRDSLRASSRASVLRVESVLVPRQLRGLRPRRSADCVAIFVTIAARHRPAHRRVDARHPRGQGTDDGRRPCRSQDRPAAIARVDVRAVGSRRRGRSAVRPHDRREPSGPHVGRSGAAGILAGVSRDEHHQLRRLPGRRRPLGRARQRPAGATRSSSGAGRCVRFPTTRSARSCCRCS